MAHFKPHILRFMAMASVLCASAHVCPAQTTDITWEQLSDITFDEVYDQNADMHYQKPDFGTELLKLENMQVAITGYVIPVDINLNYYVLSAFPFASCFFCGGAGPESVMDLQLKGDEMFKNDDRRRFCGTLVFNRHDLSGLTFVLENAKICP